MNMFSFTFDLNKEDLKEAIEALDTLQEALDNLEEDFQTFYAFNDKFQYTVLLHHGEIEAINIEYKYLTDLNSYPIVYELNTKKLIDKGWMNE